MTHEKAPNPEEANEDATVDIEDKASEAAETTSKDAEMKDTDASKSADLEKKIAEDAAKNAREKEEKLTAEAEAVEEKQGNEKEEKVAEDKLQTKKRVLEERQVREVKEEERRPKMDEEKRLKEEERQKEERRQKDSEERERLKEEEQKIEEDKVRKLEDRKNFRQKFFGLKKFLYVADQKRRKEIEHNAEVNKSNTKQVMKETNDVGIVSSRTEQEDGAKKRPSIVIRKDSERSVEDFKRTVAGPAIYWKPLSEKQIQNKIEERNKNGSIEKKNDSGKSVEESGVSVKEENLIVKAAADDTLVMEIDQADIVAEEVSKEEAESPMISAEPGQVTSLRRLGGSKPSQDASRKRGWGASKGSTSSANSVTISSNSLKDLVPDIKPLLDTETTIEEEVEECSVDSDADIAGPKIPENVKKESEPVKKKKRIPITDVNETAVVLITHLTRPFTVNQLKEMLKRTGTIVDFWIDRIKSMCCVQFSTVDQASETRMALDGVTWPQGNPKTLRVIFSTEEELKKYQESSTDALNRLGPDSNGRLGGVREWDKNKLDQEQERAKEREKRLAREKERREGKEERERSLEKKAPAVKSLEDLFKKTVAGPAIYWKPLSEKQIQQKIEERNKKIMEAQIRREMMDTKESLQRSNKLLPARRRSRSSSGSSD